MPPFLPFKRPNSQSPSPEQPPSKQRSNTKSIDPKSKSTSSKWSHTAAGDKKKVDEIVLDESTLSEASSEEERQQNSHASKRRKLGHSPMKKTAVHPGKSLKSRPSEDQDDETSDDSEDDKDHWDEYLATHANTDPGAGKTPDAGRSEDGGDIEVALGDVPEIDVSDITAQSDKKKGPSKVERQIRYGAHQMHVITLMYHNWLRNRWCNDPALHKILTSNLPPGVKNEAQTWKQSCKSATGSSLAAETSAVNGKSPHSKQNKSKKSKGQRDWSGKSARQEHSDVNASRSDPTLRFLKYLCAYWRKRFTTTAPGFRKHGYKDLKRLKQELHAFHAAEEDLAEFGEKIQSLKDFHILAKNACGSRDVGAQLFTALLRAIGAEARMVVSLQPLGFGWSKTEEADPVKASRQPTEKSTKKASPETSSIRANGRNRSTPSAKKALSRAAASGSAKNQPIDLDTSESELSSLPPSDATDEGDDLDDDASVIDVTPAHPPPPNRRFDRDLAFPIYWTEVLSPITNNWIPVDPIALSIVANTPDAHNLFEPRGIKADRVKQVMAYVVAFNADDTAKDVTVRYLKRHVWPGKTKGSRFPVEKTSIVNRRGKVIGTTELDWFKSTMACFEDPKKKRSLADDIEDERDLKREQPSRSNASKADEPDTLQAYKASDIYVLERHLRRDEALKSGAKATRTFVTGKGEAIKREQVYLREDVVSCKTVESWHKEGRAVIEGQQPLKWVPMRAVTLTRKREMEEMERETGEKPQQGLYSREQTDWIIPPPIEDGVIPKNAFGNIDVYVETMVPKGAVHVPFRGTARVCKKLGIDFAEACTGFEFGNKMAVPVLTGVVVAAENKRLLVDAWRAEERAKAEREAKKREQLVLAQWKKMLHGLRVVERVRREYGASVEAEMRIQQEMQKTSRKNAKSNVDKQPRRPRKKGRSEQPTGRTVNEDPSKSIIDCGEGGFLADEDADAEAYAGEGGFLVIDDRAEDESTARVSLAAHDVDEDMVDGGGFLIEGEDASQKAQLAPSGNDKEAPTSMRAHAAGGDVGAEDDGLGDVHAQAHDPDENAGVTKQVKGKRKRDATPPAKPSKGRAGSARSKRKVT